ncbi:hypothetical protein M8J77_010433 [Diaphorina citri]|nr:hypothetical protein M8J77_010433 [Diaphorina citri]
MDTRSGFDLIRLEFRPSPWTPRIRSKPERVSIVSYKGNTIANVVHQINRVYTAMNDFMQELKLYKFMSRLDGWQAQMLTQVPVRDWIRVYRVEAIQLEKETSIESSLHRINQRDA